MGRLHRPLLGLSTILVVGAFGMIAFRSGSLIWFRSLYTVTLAILVWSTVLARMSPGRSGAFWLGFATTGWVLVLAGFGPLPLFADESGSTVPGRDVYVNSFLVTTYLLKRGLHILQSHASMDGIVRYQASIAIGHLMLTWATGVLGGFAATMLVRPEASNTDILSPSIPSAIPRPARDARKAWFLGILATLIMGGSLCYLDRPSGPYFPDVDSREDEDNTFGVDKEKRYSLCLEAMGEPSLWKQSQSGGGDEVIRVLWLPTFLHPISLRVTKSGKSITWRAVILDGKGGYRPGILAVSRQGILGEAEWESLRRLADTPSLWETPPDEKYGGLTDGEDYLIERVEGRRYQFMDRYNPSSPEILGVFDSLVKISGIDLGNPPEKDEDPGFRPGSDVKKSIK